jgi:hypothetical protein
VNRRDLLKRLAAVPVIGAAVVAEQAAQRDLDTAHLRYLAKYLTPADAWFPYHTWANDSEICTRCGITALEVEERGYAIVCYRPV